MLKQNVTLSQSQQLKLSPKLFQSIQLMAMPLQDLQAKIHDEVEKNPALELVRENSEVPMSELGDKKTKEREAQDYDPFENTSDPGYSQRDYSGEDTKRKFMEGTITQEKTLQENLLEQLRLQPLSEEDTAIGEYLIMNLGADGFHLEEPTILIKEDQWPVMERMIPLIQKFDPQGCCTRDMTESLIVQGEMRGNCPLKFREFIQNHLWSYNPKKEDVILKALRIDNEDLEDLLLFTKTLDPYPGRAYSQQNPGYIIPDLTVKKIEGEYVLFFNDEQIPVLDINDYFTELQKEKPKDKEVKQYVNSHVKEAQWFISSIHQRNNTLVRTAKAILKHQIEFFEKGPKYLRPLTLKDIAEELEVHETTISRITTNKYMQTENGILELKYFFTNSISGAGSSGSTFSKEGVKEVIKEIVEASGEKRLSDQKISDILMTKGIKLARRTVAKYRKELDIDSSFRR